MEHAGVKGWLGASSRPGEAPIYCPGRTKEGQGSGLVPTLGEESGELIFLLPWRWYLEYSTWIPSASVKTNFPRASKSGFY